ncbi:hypothetical protein ASE63_23135 [Bosea sp. Root381]|nr:hypothetical protein ASE63_23135 [Bosea sp. Root381]
MGVLLPLVTAQAQYRYTATGTYDDDIDISNAVASISAAGGVAATYAGNLRFLQSNSTLNIGSVGPSYGTLIFSPDSISGIQTSPGNHAGLLRLWEGRFQFGPSLAGREYFTRHGTRVALVGAGTLDLAGQDLEFNNFTNTRGTVQNDSAGTAATFTLTIGSIEGLHDGAGTSRLRKVGSGAVILNGNSTYSGGTEIAYGDIRLNSATGIGTGAIAFSSNGSSASQLTFNVDGLNLANNMLISGTAGAMLNVGPGHSATVAGTISGSGPLVKYGNGTLTLTGRNSFTGDTNVQYGTLVLDSGDAIADTGQLRVGSSGTLRLARSETIDRIQGNAGGTIILDENAILMIGVRDGDSTISSAIGGLGGLRKDGDGTLWLLAENSYIGGTSIEGGRVVAGRDNAFGLGGNVTFRRAAGTRSALELSNGVTIAQSMLLEDSITLDNNDYGTLSGVITGHNHVINKVGRGMVSLTGHSLDSPGAIIRDGGLSFDGRYGGNVEVAFGGTVTGSGRIERNVAIADGGRLVGQYDRTLTMGSLTLQNNSDIYILVDAPSSSAFFEVEGHLTLDGRLTIDDGAGVNFGQGVYRLFNYGGTLTDNGLEVVGVPDDSRYGIGDIAIQTAIANQVNIVVGADPDPGPGPGPDPRPAIQFWDGAGTISDGAIAGGSGIWRNGPTNWTTANGEANHGWGGRFAVFQAAPGVVTVSGADGAVSVGGMQFAVDGYRIEGDAITLADEQTVIRVGDGSRAGSAYVATIASELRGDGALVKDDHGTLIITGNNGYRGDTLVRAGTLVGNSRSIRNNIGNNGHVVFDQAGDGVFQGEIHGRGTMEKTGAGTLTLAGAGALDWTISQGGLISRTDLFGGNVSIAQDAFLRFGQAGSGTYRGSISGSGDFQVAVGGGNLLRLTGDSSAFTGSTAVISGGLAVEGNLGGSLDMQNGTVLSGVGTIGSTVISAGATISPGNSIGTLAVNGSIHFRMGSTYEVEVDGAGQSDSLAVTESAVIDGGAVRVVSGTGAYAASTRYTILTAGRGVTGTFSEGVTSSLVFLDPSLSYDENNVYLTMTRNNVGFAEIGSTANQRATGGGVDSLGSGNAVHDAVLNLSAEQARSAFDQLSGELHASAKTVLIEDSRFVRNAVNDRLRGAFDGVGASGPVVTYQDGVPKPVAGNRDGLAFWGQGFGSWGHAGSNHNAARVIRSTGGFFIGADVPAFDNWRFGAVAGYSHSSFDTKMRYASGTSDNYHFGVYGGAQWGNLALRTGAAYSWHDVSTSRRLAFPGIGNSLGGDYGAATAQVFGELAYGFSMGATRFEPFANLAYANLHTDSFRETGGAAALTAGSSNAQTGFTTLGLRGSATFDVNGASVTARGMVGWRHAFGDVTSTTTMRFASGGNPFTIAGGPIARDAALVEAGVDFALTPTAVLGVSYGGQFGSGGADQSFKANFSAKF